MKGNASSPRVHNPGDYSTNISFWVIACLFLAQTSGVLVGSGEKLGQADMSIIRCCRDCIDFDDFRSCNCSSSAQGGETSVGTAFYATFLHNAQNLVNKPHSFVFQVTTYDQDAHIVIVQQTGLDQPLYSGVIPANREKAIMLNISSIQRPVSMVTTEEAIFIKSTAPVSVYGVNSKNHSTDAFLVLPSDLLGHNYYVTAFHPATQRQEVAIVATTNGTFVSMRLPWDSELGAVNPPSHKSQENILVTVNHKKIGIKAYTHGQIISEWLDRLETLSIIGRTGEVDLSSSFIRTTQPVAVFSGNWRARVPNNINNEDGSRDHLVQQMLPTHMWGTRYILASTVRRDLHHPSSNQGESQSSETGPGDCIDTGCGADDTPGCHKIPRHDRVTIVCAQLGTRVNLTRSHCSPHTLHFIATFSGAVFRTILFANDTLEIVANGSISVTQFTPTGDGTASMKSDPSMVMLPAIENYLSRYKVKPVVFHRGREDTQFEPSLVLGIKRASKGGVTLDGLALPASVWIRVAGVLDMVSVKESTVDGRGREAEEGGEH